LPEELRQSPAEEQIVRHEESKRASARPNVAVQQTPANIANSPMKQSLNELSSRQKFKPASPNEKNITFLRRGSAGIKPPVDRHPRFMAANIIQKLQQNPSGAVMDPIIP